MNKKSSNIIIALLIFTAGIFIARSFRVSEIPNGNINTCANCHINPAGGGARNDFGTEVENNFLDAPGISGHVQWGPELAALDSDGDGFTNGEELQDPNGVWTKADPAPGNSQFVTKPGDPNDFPTPAIIVSAPNGGESFESGLQTNISWASNVVDNVMIEFSSNNGSNWSEVSSSTESDGDFSWTIPDVSSSECLIRISDLDSDANDQSNSTFTISQPVFPQIVVVSPNGGENWEAGSSQLISWNSSNVTTVSIEFSSNNGVNWTSITTSTASDGIHNWTIPNDINSDQCIVRIMDNDSNEQDQSDNTFTIFVPLNPEILVLSPNGGDELEMGTQFEITWESNDVNNVLLELSIDNGNNWSEIMASAESDGSFSWSVPDVSSEECLIKISDIESDVFDESDNVFSIFDPTGVEDELEFDYSLSQNYPNPFNPSTTIKFQIADLSNVVLRVYSSAGELIKTVLNKTMTPGRYDVKWNGTNEFNQHVASGIYLYRLIAESFVETKRMVLMK